MSGDDLSQTSSGEGVGRDVAFDSGDTAQALVTVAGNSFGSDDTQELLPATEVTQHQPVMTPATPASDEEPLLGVVLADRYLVRALIGRGGMGSVYRAEHTTIGKAMAVKVLSANLAKEPVHVERFLQEARAASLIRHANIVDITDFGYTDDARPFFVMEFLAGEDLGTVMARERALPWARARGVALQICAALQAAHERGIVHRDMKLENCFLVEDGGGMDLVKVLDFGLAKITSDAIESRSLTQSGSLLGTAAYMAPELGMSKPADERTDIYALGVILYRMITGRMPFVGDGFMAVVHAHIYDPPPSMREIAPTARVSPELEEVILKALAKDPAERWQSVREFAVALWKAPIELDSTPPISAALVSLLGTTLTGAPRLPSLAGGGPRGTQSSGRMSRLATSLSPASPRGRRRLGLALLGALALAAVGYGASRLLAGPELSSEIDAEGLASFAALPPSVTSEANPLSDDKIELGRLLFFDQRLSKNHDIACNTCHPLDRFGADGMARSQGHARHESDRNAPSVFNAAGNFVQMWDGRIATLEEQATAPLLNGREMAMSEARVLETLWSIPGYDERFKRAFAGDATPISMENVGRAIAAFERTLMTPGRWDQFLGGDDDALTPREKQGFNAFVETGCVSCHFGPYLGATMFQKLGLLKPWPTSKDRGRFEVTNLDADWMVFKVPSLRNVAETGPYFHDGSISDLEKAVEMMAWHQLGKKLDEDETTAIVAWLGTLTGSPPAGAAEAPDMLDAGPETPKPDPG